MAKHLATEEHRDALLRIAAAYEKLAQQLERRQTKERPS